MTQRLQTALQKTATAWARKLTILAKGFAPSHVKPAISSKTENRGDGTFIIRVMANRKVAPDARAQEHGSGLKAHRGPKVEYPIAPKNRRALAFYENANGTWNYEMANPPMPRRYAPDGRGLFFGVMHPGIEAANNGEGYFRPAVKEWRRQARKGLDKEVRAAILGDLRKSFGRKS